VALAFVLLVGAGLLVRSFDRLLSVEPGFQPTGLLTARLLLPRARYADSTRQAAFYDELTRRLGGIVGVRSAALVSDAPLGDSPPYVTFAVQGLPEPGDGDVQDTEVFVASPSYFPTLRVPLLEGRGLSEQDRAAAPQVVVINQTMARRHFGGRSALGQRLTFDDPSDSAATWNTVVGVVGDIRHAGLNQAPYAQVYAPLAQAPRRWMVVVLRTDRDPASLAPAARAALASLDPDLALSEVMTMEQRIADSTARPRINTVVLGSFAIAALLLAAIGIYGVISYGVAQRTRELGIRLALGAASGSVLTLVLRQGMAPVAAGIATGVVAAWAGTRLLRSLLFEVGTTDVATFAAVTLFLAGTALAACYFPARRAARSDPMSALRAD
jgi:putative ABC transport system permease protein